jgi:methylamine utilization protein MauE
LNDASLALAARIVLAAVLTVSAGAKLRSRTVVRDQLAELVGTRFAPALASVLPAAELLVALALVAWWSAVPGVGAALLLAAFTVVLVRAAARHVPCACFGAASLDAPVGAAGVIRNGILAALAVIAVGSPTGAGLPAALGWLALLGVIAALAVRAAR